MINRDANNIAEGDIHIRPFSLPDLDHVVKMEKSVFQKDAYPGFQFKELYEEHPEGFLVAEVWGEIIGYAIGYISNDIGEIDSIAVAPNFQRCGIGQRLLDVILGMFRERGAELCSLEVRTTNDSATRFYQKRGFQIITMLQGYYDDGGDAYLMRMNL